MPFMLSLSLTTIKKAQTIAIRSQAHHKPNILWAMSAPNRHVPMYILLLVTFRGGDSRAIEQILYIK